MAYENDGIEKDRNINEGVVLDTKNGKPPPPSDGINPHTKFVNTDGSAQKTALTYEMRDNVLEERSQISGYVPADSRVAAIVTEAQTETAQAVGAFSAFVIPIYALMSAIYNQIVVLCSGPGSLNPNTPKLRQGARKQTVFHVILEIGGTAGLIFVSGEVKHGAIGAILESILVPTVVILMALIASDFGLRAARQHRTRPTRATLGLVCFLGLTAAAIFLNLAFANYRAGLVQNPPSYLPPGLFLLGMVAYALTLAVWLRIPAAAPELAKLQGEEAEKTDEVEDHHDEAVEDVHAACDSKLEDLDELSEIVQDEVREIKLAYERISDEFDDYCEDLRHAQVASENRIADHRATMRAAVDADTELPSYYYEEADLSKQFRPAFDLEKYRALAAKAEADLANVGAAVANGIKDIEIARNEGLEALKNIRAEDPTLQAQEQ